MICDSRGIHVDPYMQRLIRKIKGEDRLILISDSCVFDGPIPDGYDGVTDINMAEALVGSIVFIDKDDIELEEGRYFIEDIKGQGLWGKLSKKSPEFVAEKSLKAVKKNKVKYIPGGFNRLLNFIMKLLPKKIVLRFIARRWKKQTKDAF